MAGKRHMMRNLLFAAVLLAALAGGGPARADDPLAGEIVSAGGFRTCALTPAGAVDCWGENYYGQAEDQPGPYTQVSVGEYHTCAPTPAGAVDCWGDNTYGQAEDQPGPYTQISARCHHTCALTPAGAVDCWGMNDYGQAEDQPGPYTQVSVGCHHTCALTPAGAVDCWGRNHFGQATAQPGPYTQVGAGYYHTCALTPAGAVDCWGMNDYDQATAQPGPYTQVGAGYLHTCGLTPAGAVDCWGLNTLGQAEDQPGPYTQVGTGSDHTCALTPAGAVDCWGRNDVGQAEDQPGPYGPYEPPVSCIVTTNADSGPGSLREKIATPACDTITFDGDYTIPLASQLTIDRDMAIDGAGHSVTVSGENAVRVFYVNAGVTLDLQNLTVANGLAGADGYDGGGMWVSGANGRITTVNLQRVTFSGNRSTNEGGLGGGGLSSYNGTLSLTDVTFVNNEALTGGGLSNTYGSTTLTNVILSGNRATQSLPDEAGCGGLLSGMNNLSMTNVTFSGNSGQIGGGLCKVMGSAALTNVTFSGNQATQLGSAIYNVSSASGGSLTIVNSILWGNTAPDSVQIHDAGSPAVVTYSDIQGGWPGTGNIDADPLFVDAANGDLHLRAGSPAINSGDQTLLPADALDLDNDGDTTEPIPFDLDGNPRVFGGQVDMGAYEVQEIGDATPPVITPQIVGTLGQSGWYVGDVVLTWSVVDDESEITSSSGCDPVSITSDQTETAYTCTATSAGGTSNASVAIKRDATAPLVAVTGVTEGATYLLGAVPAAGCSTSDATAGVETDATLSLSGGNALGVGAFTATCSGAVDHAGNAADPVSVQYNVTFQFTGFFRPVSNPPQVNRVKAGIFVPVRFSLGDDYGMDIFAPGYPQSEVIDCSLLLPGAEDNDVVETVTPSRSFLIYNRWTDRYTYLWKTNRSWAGTCRQLIIKFNDGSAPRIAYFRFVR